jgi:phenylacetate-CoA ligase
VLPGARAQAAFANQLRLAGSQWLKREQLENYQLARLKSVARFAERRTEYGRRHRLFERIHGAANLADALRELPILSREHLCHHPEELKPDWLPKGHEVTSELRSSGSTGLVVRLHGGNVWARWQRILGLRSNLWAGRDFRRSLAAIRRRPHGEAAYPDGTRGKRWAVPADVPFPTGPSFLLNAYTSLDEQWDWLKRVRPSYLFTHPSILRNFARREDAASLGLQGVSTLGEVVDAHLRALVRETFNLSIHDAYSSEETGTIAIQCPDSSAYHVQSEALIVEILNDRGAPCGDGEIGRVVVTPLYNLTTPLIRYELNDLAETGGACACGRGLPMLKRIMGRRRNLLTTPDGRQYWPALRLIQDIVRVREHQYRQVAPDVIEVWLAVDGEVSAEQEEKMRAALTARFLGGEGVPAPFEFRFHYIPEFPRNPNGKHEEFVSYVT